MHISVIGSGYVGTTLAACLVDLGHEVVNVDIDEEVVTTINAGKTPVHEEGLPERIAEYGGDRLRATTDYDSVNETDVTFLCLPTPQDDHGRQDLSIMEAGAEALGDALARKEGRHVVVTKSTVLPGTNHELIAPTVAEQSGRMVGDDLGIAMNPEFLREGTAVADFMDPDKIVVGASDSATLKTVREVYADLIPRTTVIDTDVREAEMIKYANNTFLAAKVSLVNELGNVCKELDIDAYEVMDAVGLDHRIGSSFLQSGLGWGGSCFPKDTNALRTLARDGNYEPELLDAVVHVNDRQPERMISLLDDHIDLAGARIAVLGLAFKPGTDDVRNSRALDLVPRLVDTGANVVAYDPVASENAHAALDVEIEYAESANEALSNADAALIVTDWPEFEDLSFTEMTRSVVVDGRHTDIDTDALDVYEGLCW